MYNILEKITFEELVTKFYTIYKITDTRTGKYYIGRHQTENLNDGYMGSGKYIRRAISKYGADFFVKEYLFIFDNETDMYAKEAELVTEDFCLREDTYNISPGGFDGGFRYINANGLNTSALQKKKASETLKKLNTTSNRGKGVKSMIERNVGWFSPAFDGRFKGKTHTEEWKKNHSEIMKIKQSGSGNSQYGTCWINNGIQSKKIKNTDSIPEGWSR